MGHEDGVSTSLYEILSFLSLLLFHLGLLSVFVKRQSHTAETKNGD